MEGKDLISNVFLVHESTPKKMPEVRTLLMKKEEREFREKSQKGGKDGTTEEK